MPTIGEIELKALPKELIVQWTIKDYFSLSESFYSSYFFSFANKSWFLRIYPNGNKALDPDANGYISVYLRKKVSDTSIKIGFAFSLNSVDEKKVSETHLAYVFGMAESSQGPLKLISKSELLKRKLELVPSDMLTIICTLNYPNSTEDTDVLGAEKSSENELSNDEKDNAEKNVSSEIRGIKILSENLKQMLLHGRMSDAVLKVDGQEFNVHKFILVARSPVFAPMFQHDLTEKSTNEVDIPDCTAESFKVFLHYLYCGSAETLSASNVCNVYYAADKYQVDDLKEECVRFMTKNISVETFCDVVALSLRHGESKLLVTATDFFRQNIKKIIKTVEWIKYMEANATQANELLIKALDA